MKQVKVIEANSKKIDRSNSKVIEFLRVAPYCRVSTDSEEQMLSYNSQVQHYRSLVEANKDWELVDIYADEGITGTQIIKRIEFQRMINDALAGRIDLVITKSISRFARNTLDTLKYVRLLKENNVAIMFEKENINTMTMNGEMLLAILSSLAQQESESISANVKMGLKMKMKRGELVGFQGCLGYDYDKETKSIYVNHEEAQIVKYIFELYIGGLGCFVIAKELTRLGYITKKGGTTWLDNSVRKILRNEKYKGDILMGKSFTVDPITHRRLLNLGEEEKYYIANHHEPIVSAEIFDEAQRILGIRSDMQKNKGRGDKYSRKYAFSSKIECGFCNTLATRRKWHSSSTHEKFVWQCTTSTKKGRRFCAESKGLEEEVIESAFVKAFNMLCLNNKEIIEEFLANVSKTLEDNNDQKETKRITNEINGLEKKMGKLVDMRLEESIDKETYEAKYIDLHNELEKLRHDKKEFEESVKKQNTLRKRITSFRKIFEKNEPLKEFDREVFESIVEKIIFGGFDDEGNAIPYLLTFVFKAGLNTSYDCTKKPPKSDEETCSYTELDTCGVCCTDDYEVVAITSVQKRS